MMLEFTRYGEPVFVSALHVAAVERIASEDPGRTSDFITRINLTYGAVVVEDSVEAVVAAVRQAMGEGQ